MPAILLISFIMLVVCTSYAETPGAQQKAISKAYEMPTFSEGGEYVGIPLNHPGDTYRYTFVLDDDYASSGEYKVKTALLGVHIADWDPKTRQKDIEPEWGQILINGESATWIKPAHLVKYDYRKDETPGSSKFLQIKDDFEVSNRESGVPPYIFDVSDWTRENRKLTVQITNLNSSGGIDDKADYGDFIILRVGYRIQWQKLTE